MPTLVFHSSPFTLHPSRGSPTAPADSSWHRPSDAPAGSSRLRRSRTRCGGRTHPSGCRRRRRRGRSSGPYRRGAGRGTGTSRKTLVLFTRIETHAEHLRILRLILVDQVPEPGTLGRSARGVGLWIEPEHDLLTAQVVEANRTAPM